MVAAKLKFYEHVGSEVSGIAGELLRSTVCRRPSFMVPYLFFILDLLMILVYVFGMWVI